MDSLITITRCLVLEYAKTETNYMEMKMFRSMVEAAKYKGCFACDFKGIKFMIRFDYAEEIARISFKCNHRGRNYIVSAYGDKNDNVSTEIIEIK